MTPFLVLYGAKWCGPTQSLKKQLTTSPLSLEVKEVDIDDKPLPALKLGLRGTPALVMFRPVQRGKTVRNEIRGVLVGDACRDVIEEWINHLLKGIIDE